MAGISNSLYRTFVQRNTIFLATIFTGAFAMQLAFDTGAETIWDTVNRGRQWKDIKQRYMGGAEEEE